MIKLRYNASEVKIDMTSSWLILNTPDTRVALHKGAIAGFTLTVGVYWSLFFSGLLLLVAALGAWRVLFDATLALIVGSLGVASIFAFVFYRPASLRIYHTGGEALSLEGPGIYKNLYSLLEKLLLWRGQ
ncbi:hypothetical protein ACKLNZ_09890 [Thermus scotoductus]